MLTPGEPPIHRCPHALAREQPHAWAWARWAADTYRMRETGNLGVVLRGRTELSMGGEIALSLYSAAVADSHEAAMDKHRTG